MANSFEFGFFEPAEVKLFDKTTVELPRSWNGIKNDDDMVEEKKALANGNALFTQNALKLKDNNFNDLKPLLKNDKKTVTPETNGFDKEERETSKDKHAEKLEKTITVTNDKAMIQKLQDTIPSNESSSKEFGHDTKTTENLKTKTEGSGSKSSWASLFSSQKNENKETSKVIPYAENIKDRENKDKKDDFKDSFKPTSSPASSIINPEEDDFLRKIADQLIHNETVYRSAALLPRGLTNNSNWCYINATLQALLVCAPFCHLMRSLPSRPFQNKKSVPTSTPILDSFVALVKDFKPLPKGKIGPRQKETRHGPPHEPTCIYNMLSMIKSDLSKQGKQEDAEEFLSCILNGIHEEMLMSTKQYADEFNNNFTNAHTDQGYEIPLYDEESQNESTEEDGEQWEEVSSTKKNKSSVTRRTDNTKTAVSEIFRGELRSDLHQDGQKGSATLEPFFTLPLDISSDKVWTVTHALEALAKSEMVMDVTNAKTKVKGDAIRRQTLETLPPVLILQLKRFVYDKKGGSLKLDKEVQYHTDLVIGKNLISKEMKKYWQDKRAYKLFAVVYHHGKAATGGHYTADVYHDRLNCWLNIDDQIIRNTNVHEVVRHNTNQTPYLLYYKRTDLMAV